MKLHTATYLQSVNLITKSSLGLTEIENEMGKLGQLGCRSHGGIGKADLKLSIKLQNLGDHIQA